MESYLIDNSKLQIIDNSLIFFIYEHHFLCLELIISGI